MRDLVRASDALDPLSGSTYNLSSWVPQVGMCLCVGVGGRVGGCLCVGGNACARVAVGVGVAGVVERWSGCG